MEHPLTKFFVPAGLCLLLTLNSCGGSDSDNRDGSDTNGDSVPENSEPIAVQDTSYKNFKSIGLTPQEFPTNRGGLGFTRAFGDFTQTGTIDVFIAVFNSPWPPTVPAEQVPATFEIWEKRANGSYVLRNNLLLNTNDGCTHPSKSIVADFNQDTKPDVFVACHGFDAAPYPGEKNKVVLSQPGGNYLIKDAGEDIGFFHGATAADLNVDTFPDVIVTNNFDPERAFVLINRGDGTFYRETTIKRLPPLTGNYFTIELVDIDKDSYLDLLLGGHDYGDTPPAQTIVLLNPGSNDFSMATPSLIPTVENEGAVRDFLVTDKDGETTLWVLRTSLGDGTTYESRVIQKVEWPSLASSVPHIEKPGQWVPWIIAYERDGQHYIASEDKTFGTYFLQY